MIPPETRKSSLTTVLGLLAIVAALHLGRSVLIPVALAGLVAMLLTPLVRRIEKLGIGPTVSVAVATAAAFLVTCAFAWVLTLQVTDLVEKIPEYRANLVAKTASLGPVGRRVEKAFEAFHDLQEQVAVTAAATSGARAVPEPPTFRVAEPAASPTGIIFDFVVAWAETLLTSVMVLVLVVFLLLYRRDVGDRLVHLFGPASVNITSRAIGDAAESVSRYLLMQAMVNGLFGLTVAAGLFLLGVPNAFLLGLVAAVLRFIPYVGAWAGLVVPLLLSLAEFEGWTPTVLLLGGWVVVEMVTANVVEPLVYGRKTAVSPLGVLLGTLFWAWLWGPAGLVLAVPMTVSLFVLGRNVPQLAFLGTLFGSETALEPSVQLYQRLLAMDADAAVAVTDEHGRGKPLLWVCDALLVPALGLAEVDRHSEAVDEGRSAAVLAEMRGLLEIVAEGAAPDPAEATTAATDAALPILIVPAADAADEIVAQMLAECLSRTGLRAEVVPAEATPAEKTRRACERDDTVVCISSLPPNAAASTRHLYQRIRARRPDAPVVIGGWTIVEDAGGFQSRAAPDGRARLVATLADAVAAIRDLATPPTAAEPADPAPESAPAAALGTTCS